MADIIILSEQVTSRPEWEFESLFGYVVCLATLLLRKAGLSRGFMKSSVTLNIINFVDVTRREKDRVSWDVRRVSSP